MVSAPGRDRPLELLATADQALICALQPIVDVHTGVVHGVEALLRGHELLGFETPFALLDGYEEAGLIQELEDLLQRKAIAAFRASPLTERVGDVRLFVNIDGRALADAGGQVLERSLTRVTAAGLPASTLCVEISERYERFTAPHLGGAIHRLRSKGVRFAADDFGQGHSELKLLYDQSVDYIKIDRYFISGIDDSARKKLFLGSLCRLAHLLGVRVVAEGVENGAEFGACRDVGCDLVQGWFVAEPQTDPAGLRTAYAHAADADSQARRKNEREFGRDSTITTAMTRVTSVLDTSPIDAVFELFRAFSETNLFVVVDASGEPRGTISQAALRPFVYNRYGRDLLRNEGQDHTLQRFVTVCPCADTARTVPEVLDVFMAHPGAPGVIVTEGGQYMGLLAADALLTMANARYLAEALDRNPLTRLPGNTLVAARIAAVVTDSPNSASPIFLCYFDFDNFKPFNDYKGFRQGDRAIVLFVEAMRRQFPTDDSAFLGHLGGDDFVGVFEGYEPDVLQRLLRVALDDFAGTVAGMYSDAERAQGWVECADRFGAIRRFALLRSSVAVVEFPAFSAPVSAARLDAIIARLKARAKSSPDGLAWEQTAD